MKLAERFTTTRGSRRTTSGNGVRPPAKVGGLLSYRTRTLGAAALLVLLAGVLTLAYVHSYKSRVDAEAATVTVLVARRDIAPGTPGSELRGRTLAPQHVPRSAVVPGAISKPAEVEHLVAAEQIHVGEQVTARQFVGMRAQGIRGDLNGALRAIAVPGDANQLLAGILHDGDRVDVLMAIRIRTPTGDRIESRIVLRDVRVLRAAAGEGNGGLGGGANSLSVVLALTDRQAQKLFVATKHEWALVLRPFGRAADSAAPVDNTNSVLRGDGG